MLLPWEETMTDYQSPKIETTREHKGEEGKLILPPHCGFVIVFFVT
jgi:hypothetical protein